MLKFRKINFAEYVLDKCKLKAWEYLKDIDFNIKPLEPKLLSEELIKVTLQFHIIGRNDRPDYICDFDGDNCFLFSLKGEMLRKPDKEKIVLKSEDIKNEYNKAFLK